MRQLRLSVPLLLGLAASASAAEAGLVKHLKAQSPKEGVKIAVLDVRAVSGDARIATSVGETVATAAGGIEGVRVITKADVSNLLGFEAQKQLVGCGDDSCLAEIGGALGVDYLLTGATSELQGTLVVSLQLIEAGAARVANRVSASWKGDPADIPDLSRALAVRLIAGPQATTLKGRLELLVSEPGARVFVDGEQLGVTPFEAPRELAIGKHELKVAKPEFVTHEGSFVLLPDETKLVTLRLLSEAELQPWYSKWWVWTVAGVVAVAAVGTVALATQDDSGSGTFVVGGPLGAGR